MTTVDPASAERRPEPDQAPGVSDGDAQVAPGFAAVLSRAGGGAVTLGQMVGLDPLPPSAYASPAAHAAGASASPSAALSEAAEHPVVAAATEYLGVPYRWGGTDPDSGLDCSGLVQRAFADLGIAVPRVSADQARAGAAVDSLDEAVAGDLVYWAGRGGRPNHIGIYLGDGKMLNAPRTGEDVQVGDVRAAPPDAIRRIT